jgi:triacylglycerol esterase/lipase EstA (alpha/beta hydrolase family)
VTASMIVIAAMLAATPAIAKPIPCWMVKAAIVMTGSEDGAEREALAHGYTREQIAEARRKCLKTT